MGGIGYVCTLEYITKEGRAPGQDLVEFLIEGQWGGGGGRPGWKGKKKGRGGEKGGGIINYEFLLYRCEIRA